VFSQYELGQYYKVKKLLLNSIEIVNNHETANYPKS